MIKSEHQIQNEIRVALSQHGCKVFRVNVGSGKTVSGQYFTTGVPPGFPDLCGYRIADGKMFFVEVKTPTGRLRPDQITFKKAVENDACIYTVARSAADAVEAVTGEQQEN